ncbi:MAG TPA: tail fiber domain-containing protein [Bacteroidota bacterium]|nr:tail fiber domain-containing protein [Bacteroidota bacterium]
MIRKFKVLSFFLLLHGSIAFGQAPSASTTPTLIPSRLTQSLPASSDLVPQAPPDMSWPRTIAVQGFLGSPTGSHAPDGTYDLKFDLYDSLSGGYVQWEEILNGISVLNGSFSVELGTSNSLDFRDLISLRYLGVQALNGPPGFTYPMTFSPRTTLSGMPYALGPWKKNPLGDLYYDGGKIVGAGSTGYSPFKFATGAADLQGSVGIGTTTPGEALTVAGSMEIGTSSGDYRHLRIGGGNSSGYLYGSYPANSDGISIGYNAYYDAAGSSHITNQGGGTSRMYVGYGRMAFNVGDVNHIPNNPGITVLDIGHVGFGSYTPGYLLQVGDGGDGTVGRANAWNTFSDGRFKTNILQVKNAIGTVERLKGVTFDWASGAGRTSGFIAQDVGRVFPPIVSRDNAGYESLDYAKITPVLVEAIKEQQKRIDNLKHIIRAIAAKKKLQKKGKSL